MNIEEQVLQCISMCSLCFPSEISRRSSLTNLGMDSLDKAELMMTLEDAFVIEISEDDRYRFYNDRSTVDEVIHYIELRVKK